MSAPAVRLTRVEAAALAGVDDKKVYKDVEQRVLPRGRLSFSAVVYLRTVRDLGLELGVEDRKRVYEIIEAQAASPKRLRSLRFSSLVTLELGPLARELAKQLSAFQTWKAKLVEDDAVLGGEPVFPKSRLAVRRVGALAMRGVSTKEILEDYPYLAERDVEFAKLYARAYPRVGRPRARQAAAR